MEMGKNTRHAGFMPIYSDLLGAPRATLFTFAARNRYAERGQECSDFAFSKTTIASYILES
jgi:hypothetical protein